MKKQLPSDREIDCFVKNNGLEYDAIYHELCDRLPGLPTKPDLNDYKISRNLYEETKIIQADTVPVIPECLHPMIEVYYQICEQLQDNIRALLDDGALNPNQIKTPSLIERIHTALTDIAQQPDKGPCYAAAILRNSDVRDFVTIVREYQHSNLERIYSIEQECDFRIEHLKHTLIALQQNTFVLSRKKRAEEYVDSIYSYFSCVNRIEILKAMDNLLKGLEQRLHDIWEEFEQQMGVFNGLRNNNYQLSKTYFKTYFNQILPKPVYYIESPDDGTVLVGIDVTIEHKNGVKIISWWDTSHERRMGASKIKKEGEFFAFNRIDEEGGMAYYFKPMTLDIYNAKVKNRLCGKKDFDNEKDMITAFLETRSFEI